MREEKALVQADGERAGYYPPAGEDWARCSPAEAGFDPDGLAAAVAFAVAHESPIPYDLEHWISSGGAIVGAPDRVLVGPTKARGPANGVVLRGGRLVAAWGDPRQVDMTFSVTKSYLATVAGLALDRGLIRDVHDRVRDYVDDGGFDSPQNAPITWHHLLQQTSEWAGVLWDKPHEVDRPGSVDRRLGPPGTFFEYNDVRVNRLALALLRVWRRPLPEVFRELVAEPIGCSDTWQWHGYRNSWVEIDGVPMQSVSGGGHWGGGLWIHALDQARFGLLFQRRGRWQGRQLISERWLDLMTTPCPLEPTYGYLWWLNTNRTFSPGAPATGFAAMGAGGNMIWIDPAHDLTIVARWLDRDRRDELLGLVYCALGA